jgi:hypothetical protein
MGITPVLVDDSRVRIDTLYFPESFKAFRTEDLKGELREAQAGSLCLAQHSHISGN